MAQIQRARRQKSHRSRLIPILRLPDRHRRRLHGYRNAKRQNPRGSQKPQRTRTLRRPRRPSAHENSLRPTRRRSSQKRPRSLTCHSRTHPHRRNPRWKPPKASRQNQNRPHPGLEPTPFTPVKRSYLKLVRRAYKTLRHPRIRKIKWLEAPIKAIFAKKYWQPCRATAANGLSVGFFCAMLPIPLQMLVAALGCLRTRGNVPIALAACWITNPVTQVPIMLIQEKFGAWLHNHGAPRAPLFDKLESPVKIEMFGYSLIDSGNVALNAGSFIVGMLASAIILSLLAYPIVYGICLFLPNRGKSATPSVTTPQLPKTKR